MSREEDTQDILNSLGAITREFSVRGKYPFKHFTLGRPHIDILFLLSETSPLSIKEMSIRLNVTSGAITQFIDTLESMQLVEKNNIPADRRSRLVFLADVAVQELGQFQAKYMQTMGGVFSVLNQAELEELKRLLGKVRKNIV